MRPKEADTCQSSQLVLYIGDQCPNLPVANSLAMCAQIYLMSTGQETGQPSLFDSRALQKFDIQDRFSHLQNEYNAACPCCRIKESLAKEPQGRQPQSGCPKYVCVGACVCVQKQPRLTLANQDKHPEFQIRPTTSLIVSVDCYGLAFVSFSLLVPGPSTLESCDTT